MFFQNAIDSYNATRGKAPRLNKKQVIEKLVEKGLFPSYNSGLKTLKRIEEGEQFKLDLRVFFEISRILNMTTDKLYSFLNF